MLSKNNLQEIKEFEAAGINVVAIDGDGKLDYSTQGPSSSEYCDQCSALRLLPDPDPSDWFRSNDMKAVCMEVNGVIAGSLEKPSEFTNICKPLYCPKLGRKLSKDEEKMAAKYLNWAKKSMNKQQ